MGAVTPSGEMYCYGCELWKPLDAFGICRGNTTGRQSRCRECRAMRAQERRDHIAAYQAKYRQENRAHLLKEKSAWYYANRDRIAEREREKYLTNREAKIAYAKAYYWQNRDEQRAARAAYAKANRHVWNESARRRKARKLALCPEAIAQDDLDAKWAHWAGRCWICGGAADTWDHVKPLAKGGAHMLCNLRPACRSCNCSKQATWPFAVAA